QMFAANGTPIGSAFRVNTYTTDWQQHPAIAALSDGGFIIAWTSNNQVPDHDTLIQDRTDIFAQRFDAAGSRLGGEFRVNTIVKDTQDNARIASLSNGGFVIAWWTRGSNVEAQVYSSAGAKMGTEFTAAKDGRCFDIAGSRASAGGFV